MRDYKTHPVPAHKRKVWELQAFISGKCLMSDDKGVLNRVESPSLWIFHPDYSHGWSSDNHELVKIAVVHFPRVPSLVEEAVNKKGFSSIISEDMDLLCMEEKIIGIEEEVLKPGRLSPLKYRILRDELCLLFLSELPGPEPNKTNWSREEQIVDAATAWFCTHMNEELNVAQLAIKTGYSQGHLRHLFQKVHGMSPKKVFRDCQMERAAELIEQERLSILDISLECGFSSHSVFCRAFKDYYNKSPRSYLQSRNNQSSE